MSMFNTLALMRILHFIYLKAQFVTSRGIYWHEKNYKALIFITGGITAGIRKM